MADNKSQDAIALLKQDHRTVEDLFEQFEKASGDRRKQKLAAQICLELSVHATIEEEIFYPACEGKVDEDLLKESYVEHDAAKVLIAQIAEGSEESDEFFDSKVKVLQEEIEHHVEEEEKRMEGLFAQARKAGLDMDALVRVVAASSGNSTMLQLKARPMIEHEFEALFRLDHMLKDVRHTLNAGHDLGATMPVAEAAKSLYEAASAAGKGDEDFAAVIEAIEPQ
jgi:hemerythrin superfamily protein